MLMFGPYVNAVLCNFLACNFNAVCRHFFRFGEFNFGLWIKCVCVCEYVGE